MSPSNLIDARGPRFGATVTTIVLAIVLLTRSPWLLFAQVVVFSIGARFGAQKSPYGLLFRAVVKPRLAAPTKFEDAKPPQFAQLVGLFCSGTGLVGALLGVPAIFLGAVGAALAATFLNAGFGYCLGCELYLLIKRATSRPDSHRTLVAK